MANGVLKNQIIQQSTDKVLATHISVDATPVSPNNPGTVQAAQGKAIQHQSNSVKTYAKKRTRPPMTEDLVLHEVTPTHSLSSEEQTMLPNETNQQQQQQAALEYGQREHSHQTKLDEPSM